WDRDLRIHAGAGRQGARGARGLVPVDAAAHLFLLGNQREALAMEMPVKSATRARAIDAAQGKAAFDVLLTGGVVVDAATAELREADVGMVGEFIASVHPRGARRDAAEVHDVSGRFLTPGFIDTHVHFESSHLTPANYATVVVPQGTTTIFFDPHELGNVLG